MPAVVTLSPFQKEKLEYYFKFLEPDENGVLESHCMDRLIQKILKFTGWKKENPRARQCVEIHAAFFEILFEKAVEEGGEHGKATLNDWYAIWSHLLVGVKGMSGFPVWLRLMPKVLFDMIDRNEDDIVDVNELLDYYQKMVFPNMCAEELADRAKEAIDKMTDNNRYPLDLTGFEQIFANFLIGKTPHGPGKYIFGCFEHAEEHKFTLIQAAVDDENDEMQIKLAQSRRPKKFGVMFT